MHLMQFSTAGLCVDCMFCMLRLDVLLLVFSFCRIVIKQ